jgi:tetratricopeptide (TPR) repeat protein
MAGTYHQLGRAAQDRGRLEEAEDWYRKSLAISEELGDRPGMALTYTQLGNTAYLHRRLEEAEDWCRKSLAISEELGDRPGMASCYAALGLVAEAREQAVQAMAWNVRCVALYSEFPSPLTFTGPSALARLARQFGMPALEHAWQQVTRQPLPPQVRDYITSQHHEEPGGHP